MYDTIWDQIAAWLADKTVAQQLGIMVAAALFLVTILLWVMR